LDGLSFDVDIKKEGAPSVIKGIKESFFIFEKPCLAGLCKLILMTYNDFCDS
jgi:hypothetical protein